MKLTPIKGRGKGPRKAGYKPANPSKRPRAGANEESSVMVRKKASVAPIEALPIEVLQHIFLFSGETNFPRASLRIGQKLSHPSFISELVLHAFAPTWDMWMGCKRYLMNSYHGWFEDHERFGGDPKLQSEAVALRSMSIDWILNAQQMWLRRHGQDRFYQHASDYNFTDYNDDEWPDDELCGLNDGATALNGVPHRVRGFNHMRSAAACFEEEFEWACFASHTHDLTDSDTDGKRLEVHPAIRIPDRLIVGPQTMSDVRFLFWLVHSNARFAEDQGWEMTKAALDNLFAQDNAEIASLVTYMLYAAGGFEHWPCGLMPVSVDLAVDKMIRHRHDIPCHEDCTWKSVVNRLFDMSGKYEELAMTYKIETRAISYDRQYRSPWRDPTGQLIRPFGPRDPGH